MEETGQDILYKNISLIDDNWTSDVFGGHHISSLYTNYTIEGNDDKLYSINYNSNNNIVDNHLDGVQSKSFNNYWGLLALVLVFGTAAGNILVCLAIAWERRLQNVTNYFLMSLAITDLMVAILVMPLGILTLVKGM